METVFTATLKNNLSELAGLIENVSEFVAPHGLTTRAATAVNIVLDEAVSNIITYGYQDPTSHTIDVRIALTQDEVAVRLEDDGRAFNPLTVPRLDKSKPALERAENGLGIHLVRNMMRSMTYRRVEDKNIFEIWIKR